MNEGMNEHANELKNQAFDEIINMGIIDALCDRIMRVLHKQDLPLGGRNGSFGSRHVPDARLVRRGSNVQRGR